MITNAEYEAFLKQRGGRSERTPDSEDSIVEVAWRSGEHWASVSKSRIKAPQDIHLFPVAITDAPSVNAVAARLDDGYCVALYLPLIHTLANLSAAVWAHPSVAPEVSDLDNPEPPYAFDASQVPGFDLVQQLLSARQEQGTSADQIPDGGKGATHRDLAQAVMRMGDDRLQMTMSTFHASLEFVWCHEFAHILYGHTDIVLSRFGERALFEVPTDVSSRVPEALSQFLEYVADMDGASQVIAAKYGPLFEDGRTPTDDDKYDCACTVLGIVLGMYALQHISVLSGRADATAQTHPPLAHRATWVLAAESSVVTALASQRNVKPSSPEILGDLRQASINLLQQAASTHQDLHSWIARIDENAEDTAQSYLDSLRTHASGYFDDLSEAQKV